FWAGTAIRTVERGVRLESIRWRLPSWRACSGSAVFCASGRSTPHADASPQVRRRMRVRRIDLTRSSGSVRVLGMAAAGLLLVAACGQSGAGTQSQNLASDQTLKFPIGDDFGTLDPAQANAESDQEVSQNLYDGLLRFDKNLNIVPDIAANMPTVSADGLTYTFKLRPDVTFSNGDKVTSKDVVYSWNRAAAQQGAYSTNFSAV